MKRPETLTTTTSTFDSSKYSSAKSISSDMLFGNEQNVSTKKKFDMKIQIKKLNMW